MFRQVVEEEHCVVILNVGSDVGTFPYFKSWLTPDQIQVELTKEVLEPFRGSSEGKKPTVKVVREKAARWKELIAEAEKQYAALADSKTDKWQKLFVAELVKSKARTQAASFCCFG